jgi:glycosyltransferase involved in cell wall biosynthesis
MATETVSGPRADVSVIMPLYNGERYVLDAIRSVAAQSVLPRDLIVVDDGSTDGGAARLQDLVVPFQLTVATQPNRGQAAARNHGVRLSTQAFVAFLDQDDLWMSDHLEVLARAAAQRSDIAWVYGDFDEIDGRGRTVTKRYLRENGVANPKPSLRACVSRDLMVLPSASLLRRDALLAVGGFDEALSGYEDDDLFIRMFRAGYDHHFVNRAVTRFRIHAGSSSDDTRFISSRIIFGRKLRDTIEDDDRFRRYYYDEMIAPRLFQQSLDDYVRFVSAGQWAQAAVARDAMNVFAGHDRYRGRRWKLRLVQHPALLRFALQLQARLPFTIFRNPALRLR